MSTTAVRPPFERRLRLDRALMLRRRKRARRLSMVFISLGALLASALAVGSLLNVIAPGTMVQRLQVTLSSPPSQLPDQPVWLEIAAEDAPGPEAQPVVDSIELSIAPSDPIQSSIVQQQFNGRPVKQLRTMRMLVTGYCPCSVCCGKHADGRTAAGYSVFTNGGKLVAADTRLLPFGSLLQVPGYAGEQVVPVLDRGGKIKGPRLDLLFPTHQLARQWGKQWLDVAVFEYAD